MTKAAFSSDHLLIATENYPMKVPTKPKLTALERRANQLANSLFAAVDAFHEREAEERAHQAEARTRRAIERQCRKSYFRKKYSEMGLWPLPPEGTPLNI
ncbi:hypothetical protein HJB89_25285 [Rhizobium sp. NZLR8]|uniref:hypothetical protein n=1 Tax=Rhizobium sp. NZLR8 TaxID=2731104 RepID=UPI001C828519|nr:hypothetical protein [Rhizobium sp. NZLR8]MBX5160401.1 hypothetical protein [Rhizobium sp. NZLR8]